MSRATTQVAKVSIVGGGHAKPCRVLRPGCFGCWPTAGINIEAISTSEIKTSCLIEAQHADSAIAILHDGFDLGTRSA